jgi:hypothetical protein
MMFGGSQAAWREEFEVRRSHHGTIDGVQFDFRHPALQPELWALPHLVSERPRGHPGFFIASGLHDNTQTLGGTVAELAARGAAAAREDGRDILYPGDRVIVSRVELATGYDPLRHAADKDTAVLYLEVLREGEDPGNLTPMVLRRRGRMDDHFNELDTMETLEARQSGLVADVADHQTLDELRSLVSAQSDRLAAELLELFQEDGIDPWAESRAFAVNRLVNFAVLYGYRHGRLEAASPMEPLARWAIERHDQLREAGRGNAYKARKEFGEMFFAKNPRATAYAAMRAYREVPGNEREDPKSVERSMQRIAPPTSPSYRPESP